MKKQLNILLTAIMFYSRIPVPRIKNYESNMLSQSTRYLPFVGLLIGSLSALVYYCCSLVFPGYLSILLSMAFSVYLTGAFHEDGFADFCDGFGGGYTKDKVLTIMKDSRIGTYGSVGLILALGTKFASLYALSLNKMVGIIIAGHALSRIIPVILIYTSSYVRDNASSKSKLVGLRTSNWTIIWAFIFGLIPILWINPYAISFFFLFLLPIFLIFRHYVIKKIGGYTGDVLGALQQISEIVFYLSLLAFNQLPQWNFF